MALNFSKFFKFQRKLVVRKDSAEYLKDPRNANAANSLSKAFYAQGFKKVIDTNKYQKIPNRAYEANKPEAA